MKKLTAILILLIIQLNADDIYKYDVYGYDSEGYNQNGYQKDGFDKYGVDQHGYNRSGRYIGTSAEEIVSGLYQSSSEKKESRNWNKEKIVYKKLNPWNKNYFTRTYANKINVKSDIEFILFIGLNGHHEKKIYINYNDYSQKSLCQLGDNPIRIFGQTIAYFNNQAIKMNIICTNGGNQSSDHIQYLFVSDKGMNYVVNLLKKSVHPINFKIPEYNIHIKFSAKNFSKAWHDFGEGAL